MAVYAIRVIGQVDAHWSVWFDGLTISNASAGELRWPGPVGIRLLVAAGSARARAGERRPHRRTTA